MSEALPRLRTFVDVDVNRDIAECWRNIVKSCQAQGKEKEALQAQEKSRRIYRQVINPFHKFYTTTN
jgi:hypothetical protein